MLWIILIVLGVLYFILDKALEWDINYETLRVMTLFVVVLLSLLVFTCMFFCIDKKNEYMITLKNIGIKRELLAELRTDYTRLNQNNRFVNVENNNYLSEKIGLQKSLLNDITKYNKSLAFSKFRANNKLWFVGFHWDYDEFDYLSWD